MSVSDDRIASVSAKIQEELKILEDAVGAESTARLHRLLYRAGLMLNEDRGRGVIVFSGPVPKDPPVEE